MNRNYRKEITIAAVSCLIRPGDPEANIEQIEKWVKLAGREGADLALFNETSATGYWMDPQIRLLAEPLDGPTVQKLLRIAQENGVVIAAGIIESAGEKQYNTHILIGPEDLLGYHRKSSLPDGEEKYFNVGDDCNVIDVLGWKVGIAICYESVHPQTCRKLAENGAEIILAPYHNAVTSDEIHGGKRLYFNLRASENRVWYVACDQCWIDNEKPGRPLSVGAVCFIDPSGRITAVTDPEETEEHMIVRVLRNGPDI